MLPSPAELRQLADRIRSIQPSQPIKPKRIPLINPTLTDDEKNDKEARNAGFLVLKSGEAYEKQLTELHSVFLFKEEGNSWDCVRATWRRYVSDDQEKLIPKADKEMTFGKNLTFQRALAHAKEYIKWFQKPQSLWEHYLSLPKEKREQWEKECFKKGIPPWFMAKKAKLEQEELKQELRKEKQKKKKQMEEVNKDQLTLGF